MGKGKKSGYYTLRDEAVKPATGTRLRGSGSTEGAACAGPATAQPATPPIPAGHRGFYGLPGTLDRRM